MQQDILDENSAWMRPVYTLNLVVVALQPLLLLGLLFHTGLIRTIPAWGYGISISWAFYIPLWSIFGWNGARMPKLQKGGFLLISFLLPIVMAIVMGDSLVIVGLDIATFHTLGIGVGLGLVLILEFLKRIVDVSFSGLRPTGFRFRGFREIFKGGFEAPFIFLIGVILLAAIALPPIAAELVFFGSVDRPIWFWIGRYISLIPEIAIFLPLWGFEVDKSTAEEVVQDSV